MCLDHEGGDGLMVWIPVGWTEILEGFESSSPSVGVRGCGKDGGLMLAGINHVIWPPNKAVLSATKGNVVSRTGV